MKREIERFTARVRVEFRGKVAAVAVTSSTDTWAEFTARSVQCFFPAAATEYLYVRTQNSLQ